MFNQSNLIDMTKNAVFSMTNSAFQGLRLALLAILPLVITLAKSLLEPKMLNLLVHRQLDAVLTRTLRQDVFIQDPTLLQLP